MNAPFVTVIIPAYQEKDFIGKCLDSLLENDYPADRMEIMVVDGLSTDGTRDIAGRYSAGHPCIKLIDNPDRFQSFALNRGIREAGGEILIRCDAHAVYPGDYVRKLVEHLSGGDSLGSVGGVWVNVASAETSRAEAIAAVLSSPVCVGPNKYRTGAGRPLYVDTVPFGAWRKDVFEKVGVFSEELLIGEDLEFNIRLRKAGFRILLDPAIRVCYYPREDFRKLLKMMYKYGYWKNFVNKKLGKISSARQLLPPLLVLYLVFLAPLMMFSAYFSLPLAFYLILVLSASLSVSFSRRKARLLPFSVATFILSHLGYGAGYAAGFICFFILGKKSPVSPDSR